MKKNSLVVITAPSGAGKSTIINKLLEKNKGFSFAISHTTREPRLGEVDSREYYFIDKDNFKSKINNNEFLEWAEVHGNFYGTSKKEISRLNQNNKIVILDIDVQGALELMSKKDVSLKDALFIFISVDSEETLKQRLTKRGTDDLETIELRLKNSKKELALKDKWQHVIVNDNIEKAIFEIEELVC